MGARRQDRLSATGRSLLLSPTDLHEDSIATFTERSAHPNTFPFIFTPTRPPHLGAIWERRVTKFKAVV